LEGRADPGGEPRYLGGSGPDGVARRRERTRPRIRGQAPPRRTTRGGASGQSRSPDAPPHGSTDPRRGAGQFTSTSGVTTVEVSVATSTSAGSTSTSGISPPSTLTSGSAPSSSTSAVH